MMHTGGENYWKLVGYFMGRTMEVLEEKYGELPEELEKMLSLDDDLMSSGAVYQLAKHAVSLKAFKERIMEIYG